MAHLTKQDLFDCTGLVAVITGGGTGMYRQHILDIIHNLLFINPFANSMETLIYSGIGLVMARALEANGATVYIIGRRKDKLDEAAATAQHGNIIPLQGDVTSKTDLERIAAHIATETGFVNLVIANSGIMGPNNRNLNPRADDGSSLCLPTIQETQKALWDFPVEAVTDTYCVNVAGVLYTAIAFLDLLDKGNQRGNVQQWSQVMVTSSIGGFHRGWTQAGLAYTTSKAAVSHMVKSLASYLIQHRIRVNGIVPGRELFLLLLSL
jgi:NAD(P)-dependent dehydrogenase (short-subunit alcohol dehydrogenase family)